MQFVLGAGPAQIGKPRRRGLEGIVGLQTRTKSVVKAIGAGVLLGSVALVARYAPDRSALLAGVGHPAAAGRSAGSASAADGGPAGAGAPDSGLASPGTAEPAARAACPEDMALVDGDFCPELRYDCLRPTGTVGCGEYARGNRCTAP